jgi:acetyl esterase
MAINPFMRTLLNILSYRKPDLKKNYRVDKVINTVTHPSFKPLYKMWDHKITVDGYDLPVRSFVAKRLRTQEIILFFHGGGWVSGNIESYTKTCADLAVQTGRRVLSVDYRLAPEFPFPCAAEDCYQIARELYLHCMPPETATERIILMGDSAGGNLAAVVSLMAADRGEFKVKKQILIYPSTYNDHSKTSPFPSIIENGKRFLLTSKKICDYQDQYIQNKGDLNNPYFAPLLSDHLENQPDTLVITAELDPLRDEGEEYGKKLKRFGNNITIHRMKGALHGFFSLPLPFSQVKKCYQWINEFLDRVNVNEQ